MIENRTMRRRIHDRLYAAIRSVPDFPKPGVIFRDLTPIMQDPELLEACMEEHYIKVVDLRASVDVVVGMESRGFWFGPMVARALGAGGSCGGCSCTVSRRRS